MKISVIIPVYNVAQLLQRAVDSVLIQPEVAEIVLVEDGSADNSLRVCKEIAALDGRIKLLTHNKGANKGVSATRNLGIKNASCPYIAFLDGDDYYLPGRFNEAKKCFNLDNNIDGVYDMCGLKNASGIIKKYSAIEYVKPGELFENLKPIGHKIWFHINGLTLTLRVFKKTGLFDEKLKTSEDTFQWFKLASVSKIVAGNVKDPVSIIEKRPDGLSSNKDLVKADLSKMFFKLFRWCKKNYSSNSRKDMVLEKLLMESFYGKYNNVFLRIYSKTNSLIRILIIDPRFTIFHSKVIRLYAGSFLGLNQVILFFQRRVKSA